MIKKNIFKEKLKIMEKYSKLKVKKVMVLWTQDPMKIKVDLVENLEEVKVEVVKVMH